MFLSSPSLFLVKISAKEKHIFCFWLDFLEKVNIQTRRGFRLFFSWAGSCSPRMYWGAILFSWLPRLFSASISRLLPWLQCLSAVVHMRPLLSFSDDIYWWTAIAPYPCYTMSLKVAEQQYSSPAWPCDELASPQRRKKLQTLISNHQSVLPGLGNAFPKF